MHLGLALLLSLQTQLSPYADSATAALVARARERHRAQDAAVHDYQADLVTRLDASVGRGTFARLLPIVVEEQRSHLEWQAPNDVKVVTLGRRFRTAFAGMNVDSRFTRPWFVPRFLGDSIHLLGENDFPERAAIHPLAAGAEAYYTYAIADSIQITLPGRTVRAIGVKVTPTRADASLIAGEIWLDAATAETVRLSFTFVGKRMWVDSIGPTRGDTNKADRQDALVQQILRVSADLEYGLYEARFWLPYRQVVTLDVRLPWFKNLVLPVEFMTTFSNVQVNGNQPIAFASLPASTDSSRRRSRRRGGETVRHCSGSGAAVEPDSGMSRREQSCITQGSMSGGRFEVDLPPDSTLLAFGGWTDSLRLGDAPGDAERLAELRQDVFATLEQLPDSLTGRPRLQIAFDQFTDIWRYNRAEGASLGAGYQFRLPIAYAYLMAKARYAFTDGRLQGALTLRRDGPGSRLEVTGFREMRDADPLAPGLGFFNSLEAAWLARDDGDYVFVQGAETRYQQPLGVVADLDVQARYADETAPRRLAHAGLNDAFGGRGILPPNGPVLPGHYLVVAATVSGGGSPVSWRAAVEGTAGTRRHVRVFVTTNAKPGPVLGLQAAAYGWVGAGALDSVPQRDFRLGGLRTLRGYEAGAFRGPSAWAAGVDVGPAKGWLTPVVFADVGGVAAASLRSWGRAAASVGVGLSLWHGFLRLDLARPVAPSAGWRLSLTRSMSR